MKKNLSLYLFFLLTLFAGCSSDSDNEVIEEPKLPTISGLEDSYYTYVGEKLTLTPVITNADMAEYSWTLNDASVSTDANYEFNANQNGTYTLQFKVKTADGVAEKTTTIYVIANGTTTLEATTYSILPIEVSDLPDGVSNINWVVDVAPKTALYRLSNPTTKVPLFIAARKGEYLLQGTIGNVVCQVLVKVKDSTKEQSAYTASVFDYSPAPGQFVNKLPEYEAGDTHEDMTRKAGEWLIGEEAYMITLGGWGGSVTIGFDHTIVNVAGLRDFRINGNAFGAALGRPGAPFGGSCEPGIIMVAYDKNKNGKPDDDEWYEIKGSSSFSAESEPWYQFAVDAKNDTNVYRDYEMTYYKPTKEDPDTEGEVDNPLAFETIKNYIRWEDNKNNQGYKVKNVYHAQSYYPSWVSEDHLTFKGVRLPQNGINEGDYVHVNDGNVYFVLYGFRYGYVDNYPNKDDNSAIDIDWAIDKNGNKVDLPGIDFVKVYGGVDQENGWLGECSTEVERGEDLHMLGSRIETIKE